MAEDDLLFLEDIEEEEARKQLVYDEDYKNFLADLSAVVNTPSGARVICTLLERLGTFEPTWSEKNARLIKGAIMKDVGNDILDDLASASPKVHDDIQRMLRLRRKQRDALHT